MKQLIAITVFAVALASCYKAHNPPRASMPPAYKILIDNDYYWKASITDSITTYITNAYSRTKFNLSFELTSGDPVNYPIIFYTTDLPNGITISQDTFLFKLNKRINFFLEATTTGTFTINFNVFVVNKGLTTYPMIIKVKGCTDELAGTYAGYDPCGHFSYGTVWYDYKAIVTTVPGDENGIRIKNFHGLGDDIEVYAIANCDHTLTIPLQTINGYTFYSRGKGTWGLSSSLNNGSKPFIASNSDTTVYNGDTLTCFTQLQQ